MPRGRVNELTALEPGRRLEMRSVKGAVHDGRDLRVRGRRRGHAVSHLDAGDASGFYTLAGPVLCRSVHRAIENDLARLEALLETRD
jgi:hypothetical protein